MKSSTKSIFDYSDYQTFLNAWIVSQPKKGHGTRSKMAETLGKQSAFLSQVLHGTLDLSLSQAQTLGNWMKLSASELDFFLLLVQISRADTVDLKNYFKNQLARIREDQLELHKRLEKKTPQIELADQHRYYSAWYYGAARILTAIPKYQNKQALFARLGLHHEIGNRALDFLVKLGLIHQEGNSFKISSKDVFLPKTSDLVSRHHANWRMRAIQSLDREAPAELHYSSVSAISEKDLAAIKKILIEAIEKCKPVIRDSPSEELYCVNMDLFEV